jgi:hypothetical protein
MKNRREISRAMNKVNDFDLILATDAVDEAVALHKELSNIWIVLFRDSASAVGKLPKRPCCVASFSNESRCVSR